MQLYGIVGLRHHHPMMFLTTAAMAVAGQAMLPPAAPPPPSPPTSSRSFVRPKGSPANWITNDDYPSEARANGQEGTVAFRLLIDKAGAVSDCAIMRSSGFAALDVQTCILLRQRAMFTPASDASGNLIEGSYSNRLRWILPRERRTPPAELRPVGNPGSWATDRDYPRGARRSNQEGDVGFALRIGPDGRPVACTVMSSSTFPELDDRACELMMARARFRLAEKSPGDLDGATWTSVVHWKLPRR